MPPAPPIRRSCGPSSRRARRRASAAAPASPCRRRTPPRCRRPCRAGAPRGASCSPRRSRWRAGRRRRCGCRRAAGRRASARSRATAALRRSTGRDRPSMFVYCEPSPGNRKASLPAARRAAVEGAAAQRPARRRLVAQAAYAPARRSSPATSRGPWPRGRVRTVSPRSAPASEAAMAASGVPSCRAERGRECVELLEQRLRRRAPRARTSSAGQGVQRSGRFASGGASSTIAWTLMPPKPNESIPARRTLPRRAIHGPTLGVDVERRRRDAELGVDRFAQASAAARGDAAPARS